MAPRHCDNMTVHKRKTPVTSLKAPDVRGAEIITDSNKKKWRLGKSIGVGAFGEIFLASDEVLRPVSQDTAFIVKMEPFMSGPLFVERNFYLRATKSGKIEEWMHSKRLQRLGVPHIYSFGSCTLKGIRMRFIVMPKFGASIQSMFLKQGSKFHIKTTFTIALHVIEALEFVHNHGYIHADIKGLNLVLGSDDPSSAPIYLIDYGLVARFKNRDGSHKEFGPDPRMANAGTIEFSSRDSHKGVICRRSDLESLGYCLVSWLGGRLPWEDCLNNVDQVENVKEEALQDIGLFLGSAFPSHPPPPSVLLDYFTYVTSLEFNSKPDYTYIKKLLQAGIIRAGFRNDLKVTFDSHAKLDRKSIKRIAERENLRPPKKMRRMTVDGERKPCRDINEITSRVTRNVANSDFEHFDWAQVLAGDPEKLFRKLVKTKTGEFEGRSTPQKSTPTSTLANPTAAMLQIMRKKSSSESQRKNSRGNDSCCSSQALEETSVRRRDTPSGRTLRSSSRKLAK